MTLIKRQVATAVATGPGPGRRFQPVYDYYFTRVYIYISSAGFVDNARLHEEK